MRRVIVQSKDVAIIIVFFLSLEISLLLAWQIIAPLRWEREVLSIDENGYPTKSVGMCTSEKNMEFVIPYAVLNLGCLLYALYLCYVTRNIPSHLNEGKWITASIIGIFQVLLLGIPIHIIVSTVANAYFFVRACLMFIVSMSVTCFIFIPKLIRLYWPQDQASNPSRMHSTKQRAQQSRISSWKQSRKYSSDEDCGRLSEIESQVSRKSWKWSFAKKDCKEDSEKYSSTKVSYDNSQA